MKLIIHTLTILLVFSISSCKKFVEVGAPINRVVSSTVFIDDKTAASAVLGLYSRMSATTGTFSDGATTIYMGIASDELRYLGTVADITSFYTNVISPNNSYLYDYYWADPYKIIYQANACIEGLEASSSVTPILKKQLLGEAYFVRAFCFWYLLNFFGDVPLCLNTDYQTNSVMVRTPANEVNGQIISDLLQARMQLSKSYPTNSKLRPNYYTATALLSRVYLYNKNWKDAEDTATEIIISGLYSLETELNKCFLIPSKETIWQLAIPDAQIFNTIEANRFIPTTLATSLPNYAITPQLLGAFESGDQRKNFWTASKTVNGVTYTYPYKYKVRSGAAKMEHCIVFRLAELYLIRAEARTHLNNLSSALDDLNEIRHRANPNWIPFSSLDINTIQNAILNEKRIEYFAEWGHRWFDLKRTGQLNAVLTSLKTTWKSTASLLPIPSAEIQGNPKLTPNPGY